jgi:hypothetical protein
VICNKLKAAVVLLANANYLFKRAFVRPGGSPNCQFHFHWRIIPALSRGD